MNKKLHKQCKFYKVDDHTCTNLNNPFSFIRREYACKRWEGIDERGNDKMAINLVEGRKQEKRFRQHDKLTDITVPETSNDTKWGSTARSRELIIKLLNRDEFFNWKNTKEISKLLGEPFGVSVLDELINGGFVERRENHMGRFKYEYKINPENRLDKGQLQEIVDGKKAYVKRESYIKRNGLKSGAFDKCNEDVSQVLAWPELKNWCTVRQISAMIGYEYCYPVLRNLVKMGKLEERKRGRIQFKLTQWDGPDDAFVDRLNGNAGDDVEDSNKTALNVIDNKIGEYKMEIAKLTNKIGVLEDIRDEL